MIQFEKLGEYLDMLWTNTWVSKVNKTTFASDMFRVFLFGSQKKLNWLLLLKLFVTFLHWLVEVFESWIFYSEV